MTTIPRTGSGQSRKQYNLPAAAAHAANEALYATAVAHVARERKCSAAFLSKRLGLDSAVCKGLMERMVAEGKVGATVDGRGQREVFV